ncbi:MAG: hypothetical protein JWP91_670 [Fibrobacteres bacterium]|nr:hypothetical protein [Fibrobacterota bacterium]
MTTKQNGAMMRAKMAAGLLMAGLALTGLVRAEDGGADVKMKPLQFGGLQEFGMVHSGLLGSTPIQLMKDEWIDHFGTFIVQEALINDRLELQGGIGGIFEWPKPEKTNEEYGGSQYKMFYVGPSIAKATYHFGGMDGMFSLGGGMFPFKSNPDANDLGGYLLRSQPYPTSLTTGGNGGLTVIGDQFTMLQGFQGKMQAGNLGLDMLLTTETGLPPLYDWSLAFLANYKVADGLLDLGAGVEFKRLIQIKSEKTSVEALENSYFQKNGTWYSGQVANYNNPASFLSTQARRAYAKNTPADSAIGNALMVRAQAMLAIVDSLKQGGPWLDATNRVPGAKYYTPAGTMVMARAGLDLKKIIASDAFSPEDLRLYGEIAILGVKDYPVYYEKVTDRMPIMLGFNFPTFHILDLLSVQWEYFNSPNLNNTYTMGEKNWAIPYLPEDGLFSQKEWNDLTTKDNYAWSIVARKRILGALTVNAQVARDHMRTIGTDWFYGSRFEPNEILHKTSSWYWMFQLGWNL